MAQVLTMKDMERKLQRAGRKHAWLYLFCNFTALMIISAYSALMCSETVQTVFPEGGDSRKQMYAVFVMTLVGCVVFTVYAAGLFFRHKSGQIGILMAMGASRRRLRPGLFREVFLLSSMSAAAGIVAGFPFVWLLWGLFRLLLADSSEMRLKLDFRCLFLSAAFFLLVVGIACLTAWRYLNRTNIMEIIREEHMNEPVKEPGRWCGPAGAAMLLAGALMGYCAPHAWMAWFHLYPPFWISVLYVPVFPGLYMLMLHTVVYGWGGGTFFRGKKQEKRSYKNIISRGMMKFQAKQTVNNLLVITLLTAGGCFALFYLPAGSISSLLSYYDYPYDYFYQYRADQEIPDGEEVRALAGKYGLNLKDWWECDYISLGAGGDDEVEDEGSSFHVEYKPLKSEMRVLSEDAYCALTGQQAEVEAGTYWFVTNGDETSIRQEESVRDLTNMVTGSRMDTEFAGYLHYDLLVSGGSYIVLDGGDYDRISEGLTEEWRGNIVRFNVDGEDSYRFADEFYNLFVDSFDESCEHVYDYDRVAKAAAEEAGGTYWMDETEEYNISYDKRDSMAFRSWWAYRPGFRILLINDYLFTTGVLNMMFLFIFIVCLTTALVICHTRCRTIALNSRYVFDDLRKLGASPAFLSGEVRSQCGSVFRAPVFVGLGAVYLLFVFLLYANDGKLVFYEGIVLLACFALTALIGTGVYGVYRWTVRLIERQLGIR